LSADPFITEPGNTQNYNRYSYVNNNPLSFTDPSGFASDAEPIQRPRDATPIETVTVTAQRERPLAMPSFGLSSLVNVISSRAPGLATLGGGGARGGQAPGSSPQEPVGETGSTGGGSGEPCAQDYASCMRDCLDESRVWMGGISQAAGGAVAAALLSRGRWQSVLAGAALGGSTGTLQGVFPDNKAIQVSVAMIGAILPGMGDRSPRDIVGTIVGQATGEAIGNGASGGATVGGLLGIMATQLEGVGRTGRTNSAAGRRNGFIPRITSVSPLQWMAGFGGGMTTDLAGMGLESFAEGRCNDQCGGP
jgi:hypothetical protein